MNRWAREDSDEGRLPEGMERVGYDADTQTYSYRDSDGSYWEGDPGATYGVLHRSGTRRQPMTIDNERDIRKGNSEAWRYMLPFFLLVLVSLLLLFRFLGFSAAPTPLTCAENSIRYEVKSGDSCWAVADHRGVAVADIIRLNPGLDCILLKAGREICVPVSE